MVNNGAKKGSMMCPRICEEERSLRSTDWMYPYSWGEVRVAPEQKGGISSTGVCA